MTAGEFPYLEDIIGGTPVVCLRRLPAPGATVLAKLEGANPAGSVKDRAAFSMILDAAASGRITPGDELVEATSGNTGIALAAAAAALGYRLTIVIPGGTSQERLDCMAAFGARIVLTPEADGMEGARDGADALVAQTGAVQLDQFANPANPLAHMVFTAREIWEQTGGRVTHVVCTMGTTGTLTGVSRALAEIAPGVKVIGVQPAPGESVPGIRAWPAEYLPAVFDPTHVAEVRTVTAQRAIDTARELARVEGLMVGPSSGGAAAIALDIAAEQPEAVVLFIAPDRGDRYLSTGLYR